MGLTDNLFIFILLPLTVILNRFVPQKLKNAVLLISSAVFYWLVSDKSTVFCLFAAVSVLANWMFGQLIGLCRRKKIPLSFGVIFNAVIIVVYRLAASGIIPGKAMWLTSVGVSYLSFRNISYLHEIYKGVECEKDIVSFAAFDLMFPRIIEGPLQKYSEVMDDLHSRQPRLDAIYRGLERFILGFGLKMIVSQQIAPIYSSAANFGFESASTPMAWICLLSYSVCLYADFFGYSLMSDGICVMLGFKECPNFDEPYSSRSVSEFWRRWHISLGRWFRENVYFPLGGSRHGKVRMFVSTLAVWLFTGLWHGFSLPFLIWGLISFVFVYLEKISADRKGVLYRITSSKVGSHIYLLLYVAVSWSLFLCTDMQQLAELFKRLVPFFGTEDFVDRLDFLKIGLRYIFLLLGVFICTPYASRLLEKIKKNRAVMIALLTLIFWISVYIASVSGSNPFMYADY
ncbi:MAG: MBOAT family protein [Firmicutes bacterium]|nr:MBOAT family protein [Candidatus Colimorpha enterica]